MSRPPLPGETPTKVVFQGVNPGSPLARLLYQHYQGEIGQFHSKARQARLMPDQPGGHMHKALPGGGQLRYSYNNGQEVLTVKLEPKVIERIVEEFQTKIPERADPTLAIDILFTNETYTAYDVVKLDRTIIVPGGTNPGDGGFWDVQVLNNIENALRPWRESSFITNYSEGTVRVEFVYQKAPVNWYEDLFPPRLNDKFFFDGPVDQYHVYAWCKFTAGGGFGPPYDDSRVSLLEIGDYQPGTGPTTYPPRTEYYYAREVRDLFDVVIPAGAVGDVQPDPKTGDKPYEAEALGRTGNHKDDRLIPCAEMNITKSCTREFHLTLGEGSSGGETGPQPAGVETVDAPKYFYGQGFLARPHKAQIAGMPVEKTVIYLYLATSNNIHFEDFPGGDPDFEGFKNYIKGNCKVQVREFGSETPTGVRVDVKTDEYVRRYTTPIANQSPSRLDTEEVRPSIREGTWVFAAGANWVDGGNEPAEPDRKDAEGKDMMGKLLAEREIDFSVEFPSPPGEPPAENVMTLPGMEPMESKLYHEPEWPGDILIGQNTDNPSRMRFLCRIEWTPPEKPYLTGSAKIIIAKLPPQQP